MDLLQMLTSNLSSDSAVDSLAEKTGASNDQVKGLLSAALPQLLNSMTSNASSQEGAQSLLHALTQHTDTTAVNEQIANADIDDGGKIIQHIFGNNTNNTINSLAGNSGLSSQLVSLILSSLAPALLSGLSGATQSAAQQQAQPVQQPQPILQAQPVQQAQKPSLLGGLLGSLFGKKPAVQQAQPLQQVQPVQPVQPVQQIQPVQQTQGGGMDLLSLLLGAMQ